MDQDEKKQQVAKSALQYIEPGTVIGIGTGSTVNFFIAELAAIKHKIEAAVSSSEATERLLNQHDIPVVSLNDIDQIPVYVDGADEATRHRHLIKGGGGALTREKIVAAASKQFICLIDDSKLVDMLGNFPLPVEVIPMAQSYVSREIVKIGGQPELRHGFKTDNDNIILDIHHLKIYEPDSLESDLNNIAGVVTNGIFARRPADLLLIADNNGVSTLQ